MFQLIPALISYGGGSVSPGLTGERLEGGALWYPSFVPRLSSFQNYISNYEYAQNVLYNPACVTDMLPLPKQ